MTSVERTVTADKMGFPRPREVVSGNAGNDVNGLVGMLLRCRNIVQKLHFFVAFLRQKSSP
jgi:hypothetical protein